jgi:transcription termination factor NusA
VVRPTRSLAKLVDHPAAAERVFRPGGCMRGNRPSSADMFERMLNVDRSTAEILVSAGISSLEELAYVPMGELLGMLVPRLSESDAQSLRRRARDYLTPDGP